MLKIAASPPYEAYHVLPEFSGRFIPPKLAPGFTVKDLVFLPVDFITRSISMI